jgi:hypothetical protein
VLINKNKNCLALKIFEVINNNGILERNIKNFLLKVNEVGLVKCFDFGTEFIGAFKRHIS